MTPPQEFNRAGRRDALTRLGRDHLDLLIVGGGITGCGIARDAALRGWAVGLVEKEDFAFGTSSRSSKIVHGGVRYLEYGHFLLVREAAQERAVLQTIAPHLVHPLPFVFPVFGGESLLKIRAGLTVFDFLAASEGLERHENLSPEEVREQLPGLRDPLKGAVRYPEYITDDARLTLENAQAAAEHGALVVNHARAEDLRMNDGRVAGCSVVDLIENRTVEVSTRLIVNATGAWSAGLLAEAGFDAEFSLLPSKGIHILLAADRLPIKGATFLRATNGKRGLAMRRLDFVYVGTTDDEYDGSLDRPRATRSDVDEVLNMVSDCFPEQRLGYDDILATWAGVRPLIREEGKSARDTSREDAVWHSPPGLSPWLAESSRRTGRWPTGFSRSPTRTSDPHPEPRSAPRPYRFRAPLWVPPDWRPSMPSDHGISSRRGSRRQSSNASVGCTESNSTICSSLPPTIRLGWSHSILACRRSGVRSNWLWTERWRSHSWISWTGERRCCSSVRTSGSRGPRPLQTSCRKRWDGTRIGGRKNWRSTGSSPQSTLCPRPDATRISP